jgi:acyl-CoA synthetase (AMP-forming)/AMP-acid ligase II
MCGSPIPGIEGKLIDAEGKDVGRHAQGELLLRGFGVMAGYYRDEAGTREAIDEDGWLHTGDIAYMDDLGYIKITDRKKDIFIVGGFNVYPAEVELLMLGHPGIARAAVVGVTDDRMGEVGAAFVVAKDGVVLDPQEIRTWCVENMANYKRPRHLWVVEALPHNASGKVIKFELRERARQLLLSA